MADQDVERKDEPYWVQTMVVGCCVIMEIARLISQQPMNTGVEVVFFDVEDQGESNSPRPSQQPWCKGLSIGLLIYIP